jgi:branched-chain amino acid transport system substrate-binding protein
VVDDIDPSHVQYNVLKTFKNNYETKFGEEVSTFAGHAYDALHLVVNAIKAKGSDERDAIRDGVESQKNFVGTAGVFNLSPTDHCGLKDDAFALLTVKEQKFRLP